jgi:biotin transport system substrate-specific component
LLGANRGAASQLAYLAAGTAGAPVFSQQGAGFGWLLGPTGGYLAGFVVAAWLLGRLADAGWTRSVAMTAAAFAVGTAAVFLMGVAWLSLYIGLPGAVANGVVPFIPAEIAKGAAVVLAVGGVRVADRRRARAS